jgi:succinate dehydrogenase cytochrome b556 subunit
VGDRAPLAADGTRRRLRWGAVAGVVVFGYLVLVAVDLVLAGISRRAFTSLHEAYGSLGGRVVIGIVLVAVVFHAFDGLRRLLEELRPSLVPRDERLRAGVAFATAAVSVPGVVAVLWPAVRGWFV